MNALKHGFRSAEAIAAQKESNEQLRDLKRQLDELERLDLSQFF